MNISFHFVSPHSLRAPRGGGEYSMELSIKQRASARLSPRSTVELQVPELFPTIYMEIPCLDPLRDPRISHQR